MSEIKDAIQKVLHLEESLLQEVMRHLEGTLGVTELVDLEMLQESDLKHLLFPIQCRKLVRAFQKKGIYKYQDLILIL
jgi:hypothetical protein